MKQRELRNWLGIYFLVVTIFFGGLVLFFPNSVILPIGADVCKEIFEIIMPVLIGQLSMIFSWFGGNARRNGEREIDLPAWVVKGPPLLVAGLLLTSLIEMSVANAVGSRQWTISPDQFKAIVIFCVTVLNATTGFIVVGSFRGSHASHLHEETAMDTPKASAEPNAGNSQLTEP